MALKDPNEITKRINDYFEKHCEISSFHLHTVPRMPHQSAPRSGALAKGLSIADLKKSFEGAQELFEVLENCTEKLKYGYVPKKVWKNYYIFPEDAALKKFDPFFYSKIANKEQNCEKWIKDISREIKKESNRVYILLGKKGCGKSSFIKYLANYKVNLFSNSKTIPSRVEYSKVRSRLSTSNVSPYEALKVTLRECLFRDTLRFLVFSKQLIKLKNKSNHSPRDFLLNSGCVICEDDVNDFLNYPNKTRLEKKAILKNLTRNFKRR